MERFDATHQRLNYDFPSLDLDELDPDPVIQLQKWMQTAAEAGVGEPNAMALATVNSSGYPGVRMVLAREVSARGLTFFTNFESPKAKDLEANPAVSVCFWWQILSRQVRVTGIVEKLSSEESDAYFLSRPIESQIASALSPQSAVISSKEALLDKVILFQKEHAERNLSRPVNWGGYLIRPESYEFWQGQPARLHDRFLYVLEGPKWIIKRLAP